MPEYDGLSGFLGGRLNIQPSTRLNRRSGSPEDRLIESITAQFDGGQANSYAEPPEPHRASEDEKRDFARRAAREMISAFGGNVRGFEAKERRLRQVREEAEILLQARDRHDAEADAGLGDLLGNLPDAEEDLVADWQDEDDEETTFGEVAWR